MYKRQLSLVSFSRRLRRAVRTRGETEFQDNSKMDEQIILGADDSRN